MSGNHWTLSSKVGASCLKKYSSLAIANADIDVIFHCDTDWKRFLPYFKEFPRGRCVLQLDGATGVFKAKEILRGHMALHGDVPATLLTLGTPNR